MTSKTITTLAFAAGCVLALGAMPSAQAQYYPAQPPVTYAPAQPPVEYMPTQPSANFAPAPRPRQFVGTTLETNGPQASRGDFGDWSAMRNNMESARYDRLLQTNPGFRHARMRKECGPINDPQLHAQCMSSFGQFEPMVGSSTPPRRWHHRSGY